MKNLTLLFLITASCLFACTSNKNSDAAAGAEFLLDSIPGQCPFLTKDSKGKIVLSWVRMNNDSSSAFCYAVSKDGKTLGSPVVIPNSGNIQPHGENLPKIILGQYKEGQEMKN